MNILGLVPLRSREETATLPRWRAVLFRLRSSGFAKTKVPPKYRRFLNLISGIIAIVSERNALEASARV